MFRYNESSMVCAFIQNILRNKYIPTIPMLRYNEKEESLPDNINYIKDNKIYAKTSGSIKYIEDLEFGKKYLNITSNYTPTCNYYSTELHEWLGRYLRTFSDYYRIDLMAFYNCFSNRLLENVGLPITLNKSSGTNENESGALTDWYKFGIINSNTQITCFPIRPNTNYIIKLYGNVSGDIIAQPIYFNGTDFLRIESIVDNSKNVKIIPYTNQAIYNYNLEANKNNTEYEDYIRNQKYLYLILQIPQLTGNLRISVIEESEYFNTLNKTLLNLNDIDYNVPFSDRLLEYLTENVITRIDKIKQNISRVQEIIKSTGFAKTYYPPKENDDGSKSTRYIKNISTKSNPESQDIPSYENADAPPYNNINSLENEYTGVRGIYDDSMRAYLYDALINAGEITDVKDILNKKPLKDFNGYVDKDVEQLLMKIVSQDKLLQEKLLEI